MTVDVDWRWNGVIIGILVFHSPNLLVQGYETTETIENQIT